MPFERVNSPWMALMADIEWTSACTGLAPGQGEVPRWHRSGTDRSEIPGLQFRGGEVGIRAGNKSLKKKKKKAHFLFSSLYFGSVSCTADSRTLETKGGVGWGLEIALFLFFFFLKGQE